MLESLEIMLEEKKKKDSGLILGIQTGLYSFQLKQNAE